VLNGLPFLFNFGTYMYKVLFILIILVSATQGLASNILDITTITDRNGLSQNTVRCMMQDSQGFMWLGTINGLNRYNGRDFTVIHPQLDGFSRSSDSRISGVLEDRNGFIWIQTYSHNLFCYDPRLEKMVDYAPMDSIKIFSQVKILSNGDIWLHGKKGCCRVRYINGEMVAWKPNNNTLADRLVKFVFEDSRGRVWIATEKELFQVTGNEVVSMYSGATFYTVQEIDNLYFVGENGVVVFDNKKSKFLPTIAIPQMKKILYAYSSLLNDGLLMLTTNERIYILDTKTRKWLPAAAFFQGKELYRANIISDNKGHIWVYNKTGVLWRHHLDNTFKPIKVMSPEVLSLINQERYTIYHDSRGIIWIATFGNGLFAIDDNAGKLQHYTITEGLPTNYLLCMGEDKSGEIWIGTELRGAAKISPTNYSFDLYYPAPDGKTERDNAVRLIYEDADRNYWFGTRDGNLHICDDDLHQLYEHRIEGGLPFTIAEDTLGRKWLGTKGGGLFVFSPNGDRVIEKHILHDQVSQASSSNNIFTVLRDNKNRMWLATFGGGLHLAEYNQGKIDFRQFKFGSEHFDMMRSMIQDKEGLIWCGTNDGIVVFDPDELLLDETKYRVLHVHFYNKELSGYDEVKVIYEDSKGYIWLGTTGGGLHLLVRQPNLEQSVFKHFGEDNGLSNGTVQAILEDDAGEIWVSTENGISRFNIATERFENFVYSNSKHTVVFNELSCWKKSNGELMFGSYNGVYTFNPSKMKFDTYAPQVLITGLQINGNSVYPGTQDSPLSRSIVDTRKIVLEYGQNSFNLECTMLNYHASELNQYAYYLDGYEKSWNRSSQNNVAAYRNVPSGAYVFKVKGCNSLGVWSEQETELEIVVLPPWWRSGKAILVYIVFGLIIVYLVSRIILKMHRLNTAVAVEKQLTEYKLRFFTNISHEFRTPLTIIKGAIEDMSNRKEVASLAGQQLTLLSKSSNRLMRLIDQLLEFRRLQNDKMELKLERTDIEKFFYDIYLTFNDIAEKKHIEYLFESNVGKRSMLLDRSKMDKIAYNLLSNAFKNTPAGGRILLSLNLLESTDRLLIAVSDNGPGVPADKQKMLFVRFEQIHYTSGGTGIGLHLTSELAKVHKGNVAYENSVWGGACFSVTIPFSDQNYDEADIIDTTISTSNAGQNTELITDSLLTMEKAAELLEASVDKPFKEYKVMVIDDDEDVRGLIKMQLGKYFTVSTAINGAEGLEKLAEEQPDLVICDIMMPEMDGIEFTKRLKSSFDISHIPVILLTAYSSEEHQLKGIQAGADSYITKPFSVRYLLARVVKLIEQREKLQRKFVAEPGVSKPLISTTERDKAFMDKIHLIIEKNMGNTEFKLEAYASSLGVGRTIFFGKMKSLVGYSPNEYVRILRMKKAAELLLTTRQNISEISYQVGINDPFYFSRCFKESFGKSPSQYRKDMVKDDNEEVTE